jgi:hypothetical protein
MKLDLITNRTDRILVDAFGAAVFVIGGTASRAMPASRRACTPSWRASRRLP